jgi:hypothetical protein
MRAADLWFTITVQGVPRDPLDRRCLSELPQHPVVVFVHLRHAAGRFFRSAKGRPARDRVAA